MKGSSLQIAEEWESKRHIQFYFQEPTLLPQTRPVSIFFVYSQMFLLCSNMIKIISLGQKQKPKNKQTDVEVLVRRVADGACEEQKEGG